MEVGVNGGGWKKRLFVLLIGSKRCGKKRKGDGLVLGRYLFF